ncbi:MAG: SDR family NAD(P)-dependent oxidoreductase, partial [Desulfuromonadaceae bacterium]|nr:SDR family NAD(P)-dependent oxidoreductase [Desulfuromonadaceae bacterium]
SIKRVEILSAMQEQVPELPAVQPDQLGSLQTLRQIVVALGSVAVAAPICSAAQGAATSPAVDVAGILLQVVADKTGYPTDMLDLDMSLDADLGIDSIKRVEILSAMQEQVPELPAVQPDQLGSLQTLRQIVDALQQSAPAATQPLTAVAPAAAAVSTTPAMLQRQVIEFIEVASARPHLLLEAAAPVWVVDDCSPLSAALVKTLRKQGQAAEVVSPKIDEVPDKLAALIVPAPLIGSDSVFLQDTFLLLQRCRNALHATRSKGEAAVFLTVSRLDGRFGFNADQFIADALSGGLAGLSKTAHHEWPTVHCKALDLAGDLSPEQQVESILNELRSEGPLEIGISAAGCVTPVIYSANLPVDAPLLQLSREDVVVISGGARGVTAEVAIRLAENGAPTLLLLGRSPLPQPEEADLAAAAEEGAIKQVLLQRAQQAGDKLSPKQLQNACQQVQAAREVRDNIHRMEQAGSKVLYRSLDIRDEQAVAAALEEARALGTVRGVIHGAGVLADRRIEDKTAGQFELVYSTKVAGLQALMQATIDDPLRFIALFSSSTGRFGRTGQIDYAVANEVLNKTAQAIARQRCDCRVLSLNWGPWDGGMVTPALKKLFASEGIEVIDLVAGSRYLLQELASDRSEVELVLLGGDREVPPPAGKQRAEQSTENATAAAPATLLPHKVLDLGVDSASMPFLRDHVLNGKAVVPMAMITEWLALGAMHNHPGLLFHGFDNLRICKGLILEGGQPQAVELRCGELEKDSTVKGRFRVPVQLVAAGDGRIFSQADILLVAQLPAETPTPLNLDVSAGATADVEIFYRDGSLFHGPLLQGLRQLFGNEATGIDGLSSAAPAPQSWMAQPLRSNWLTDPQALDSAFQLMILWTLAEHGQPSLPSFAGRYRQYAESFPATGSRIRCVVRKSTEQSATADIDFVDPQSGRLIARLEDYQCTLAGNLKQAFVANRLA